MGTLTLALTGGTGFVGRELLTALLGAGHKVVALHRRDRPAGLLRHERLNWASLETLAADLRACRFDAVFHLATAYGPGLTLSGMVAANVEMPLRLLECAATGGCPLFVNTDTFFAKPAFDYPHMRPYIQSKAELLRWIRLAADTTPGLKVVNARLEHVYGPGDGPQKFVPHVLDKLLAHEPLALTSGEQLRDFVHLHDVVAAYMTVLDATDSLPAGVTEVEIGTGAASSVKTFVETARALSGSRSALNFGAQPYRDREIMHSVADTRALRAMGWEPRLTLREGIQATLDVIATPR